MTTPFQLGDLFQFLDTETIGRVLLDLCECAYFSDEIIQLGEKEFLHHAMLEAVAAWQPFALPSEIEFLKQQLSKRTESGSFPQVLAEALGTRRAVAE